MLTKLIPFKKFNCVDTIIVDLHFGNTTTTTKFSLNLKFSHTLW